MAVTTHAENAADLGFPAPSSFPTLTLQATTTSTKLVQTKTNSDKQILDAAGHGQYFRLLNLVNN